MKKMIVLLFVAVATLSMSSCYVQREGNRHESHHHDRHHDHHHNERERR